MNKEPIQISEKKNRKREKTAKDILTISVTIGSEIKSTSVNIPKPLVKKVEGPFTADKKLVEEMIEGKEYIFKATEFQQSIGSPLSNIWWSEKLDDGEITDLEYKKGENPYLDEEGIVCFKYTAKKAEKIRDRKSVV